MIARYDSNSKHWSDTKRYLHIDIAPTKKEKKQWVCKKVQNTAFISKHSFLPLIRRVIKTSRYRKKYVENTPIKRVHSLKEREICYACHLDSIIYRFYAEKLQAKYEEILQKDGILSKSIVAYRQLPIDELHPEIGNKCNIEFANDAFQFIKESNKDKLFVGVYDITSFFNNLDHKLLKDIWLSVCGFDDILPSDHYAVYKHTVMYSYINEEDIFNLFKDRIICYKSKNTKTLVKRRINKSQFLYSKKKRAVAFCLNSDLKEIKREKLIQNNKHIILDNGIKEKRTKGIPQGLPISAVLANMYMLSFDKEINKFITNIGGLYRRYSDDIIVVCEEQYKEDIDRLINIHIENLKLEIKAEKKKEYLLTKKSDGFNCKSLKFPYKTQIEYLGFGFDGKRTLLKSASLAGYYSKMNKYINRSKFYSKTINNQYRGHIFKNQLFQRFTVYGSKRKKIYRQWKNSRGKVVHMYIGKKTWGNYISYVHRAAQVMNEPSIRRQIKRHLPILREKLKV